MPNPSSPSSPSISPQQGHADSLYSNILTQPLQSVKLKTDPLSQTQQSSPPSPLGTLTTTYVSPANSSTASRTVHTDKSRKYIKVGIISGAMLLFVTAIVLASLNQAHVLHLWKVYTSHTPTYPSGYRPPGL